MRFFVGFLIVASMSSAIIASEVEKNQNEAEVDQKQEKRSLSEVSRTTIIYSLTMILSTSRNTQKGKNDFVLNKRVREVAFFFEIVDNME